LEEIRRREMERAKVVEENRRRHEEEERRRLEQHSVLVARQAIQKVRMATPENFDELRNQVEETLMQELPKCGTQAERIREESNQLVEQAQQRIDGIKEMRRKEEDRRTEEERSKKEQEENTKRLMAELAELAGKAEKDVERLKEAGAPFVDLQGKDMGRGEALDAGRAVDEAGKCAKDACKACTEFIVTNRNVLEQGLLLQPTTCEPPQEEKEETEEAKTVTVEAREELLRLQVRVQECFKLLISTSMTAKVVRDKAVKRASAAMVFDKRGDIFDKYDKDRDGFLNQKELCAYAKSEFSVVLPPEAQQRILGRLGGEAAAIPKDLFQKMRMAVGIVREEEASKERRRLAEERRKLLEEKKAALQADISKVTDSLEEVEKEVIHAEGQVRGLHVEDLTQAEKVAEAVKEGHNQVEETKSEIVTVRSRISELNKDVDPALQSFVVLESRRLEVKTNGYATRLTAVETLISRARAFLVREEELAMERLKTDVLKAAKAHVKAKKLSVEDCFNAMDNDRDGFVGKGDFINFAESLEGCDFESERLERLFQHLAGEGQALISQEAFLRHIIVYYRVVKETLLTSEMDIKDGKTFRRVDVDEVIAVHEGPQKDDNLGIMRVRGHAVKDGTHGWATAVGNTGGIFLEEGVGECTFEVVEEVPLTLDFEPEGSDKVRMLAVGERLHILEWDKKHEASGVTRLKVKVVNSEDSGWATKMLPDETRLLRLLWQKPS